MLWEQSKTVSEARKLLDKASMVRSKHLGPTHPDTLVMHARVFETLCDLLDDYPPRCVSQYRVVSLRALGMIAKMFKMFRQQTQLSQHCRVELGLSHRQVRGRVTALKGTISRELAVKQAWKAGRKAGPSEEGDDIGSLQADAAHKTEIFRLEVRTEILQSSLWYLPCSFLSNAKFWKRCPIFDIFTSVLTKS